ncbi:hypothetical protein KC660_00490 [Candidatus Dojkabacteria bacterium]|uniref:Uncharacterized protein n=1 Tax=Candidatus Dojkabacteria bacterium TaxID=2099670 RepID=A0A955L361_9BACT|nr:hypothetical protein [Candidatus Dojkabacteria bacterium]
MSLRFSIETGTVEASGLDATDGVERNRVIINDDRLSTLRRFAYPLAGCVLAPGDKVTYMTVTGIDNNGIEMGTRVFGIDGTTCNTCPLIDACFHNYAIKTYELGESSEWREPGARVSPEVRIRVKNLSRLADNIR